MFCRISECQRTQANMTMAERISSIEGSSFLAGCVMAFPLTPAEVLSPAATSAEISALRRSRGTMTRRAGKAKKHDGRRFTDVDPSRVQYDGRATSSPPPLAGEGQGEGRR